MSESRTLRLAVVAAVTVVVLALIVLSSRDERVEPAHAALAKSRASQAVPRHAQAPRMATPSVAQETVLPVSAAMTACIDQARLLRIRSGWTDLDEDAARDLEQRSEREALASMAASADPLARAAADYFEARRHLFALASPPVCGGQDSTCRERLDARAAAAARHAERLVGQALATANPLVYGWAYRVCTAPGRSVAPACQLVGAAQWARLDPGNATPWFAVAQEAQRGKDRARLDEAMFQIGSAERHDGRTFVLPALLAAHASPADANPFGAGLLATKGEGLGAMADVDDMQSASAYCSVAELANANRREVCQRVGTLIAERSATWPARSTGRGLGKRLGWSPERLQALAEASDARSALLLQLPPAAGSPACSAILRDLEHIRSAAAVGDVEAVRRRVAASGESPAVLAARHRAEVQAVAIELEIQAAATPYSAIPPPAR